MVAHGYLIRLGGYHYWAGAGRVDFLLPGFSLNGK